MNFQSWPKPSIFPWCSVTLILLNACTFYGIALLTGSQLYPNWESAAIWTSVAWVLNGFFFWAEYDDYRRESNNYKGWNAEMRYLAGDNTPKSWSYRVNQLRKPRE